MPVLTMTSRKTFFLLTLFVALCGAACGGRTALEQPGLYGTKAEAKAPAVSPDQPEPSKTVARAKQTNPETKAIDTLAIVAEASPAAASPAPKTDESSVAEKTLPEVPVAEPQEKTAHSHLPIYFGGVDNEDSASAVDDAVWRLFDLADEYHAMGVIANREASWEEAQYYFEKALTIMANLDIEADTIPTPEATKYEAALSNIVSDYQVTLRSLGQLKGNAAPSVLVERFGDLEGRLSRDSLRVYGHEEHQVQYDLPVKMNDRVKNSLVYFQTVAKDAFRKYLVRSKRYTRMFKEVLTKHDMPLDLIYLSLVESGYNPKAYSWARASGLWQFISSTGREYGLNRSWWVDERRDPVKSTEAAATFLGDLYKQFGDWELAMAAYNGGPGRVRGTIRKQGTIDFWKMKLRRQTMDYIPLIYAAAIIAKDPERYGFYDIEFEPEVVWDEVTIDRCLDLKVVAREVGCSVDEIKRLNPELLRNYTPPNSKSYLLKVPKNSKAKFLAAYDGMPSPKETSWVKHKIRRGETVSTIASRYGVSQYAIFESNNLSRRSKIYAGKTLIVPVPLDREYARSAKKKNREYVADGSSYSVRSGDTMWDIARAFGTSVAALRRINYIERGSRIYVGQKLKIPSSAKNIKALRRSTGSAMASAPANASSSTESSAGSKSTHKVKAGDTLWDIARAYGTTTANLRRMNSLGRTSRIYPGQMLTVSGGGGPGFVVYKVRRGDNLSSIAKRFRTSIARILTANHLTDPDNLRIGQKLRIKTR